MLVAATVAFGLAACGVRSMPEVPSGPPPRDDDARIEQQARAALDRWDRALRAADDEPAFVPLFGVQTEMVGTWEASVGGNTRRLWPTGGSRSNGR